MIAAGIGTGIATVTGIVGVVDVVGAIGMAIGADASFVHQLRD